MKSLYYILIVLFCSVTITACTGPVIIDEEEKENTGQNNDTQLRDSVPIVHKGTFTSPYSIAEAQTLGRGKDVWVEGYIVGCVTGSMKSGCNYSANATTNANLLLADTFPSGSEYDHLYCIPVELPNGDIRDFLGLYDNPGNYHRKVRLQGNLTLYYSVVGMKGTYDYSFDFNNFENVDDDDNNEDDNEDDDKEATDTIPGNSMEYPLSITQGIQLQDEDNYNQAWIRGYIVGYAKGNNSIVYLDDTEEMPSTKAKSNIVLADSIGERDNTRVIVVELPTGFIRDDVNLYYNPHNIHKRLTVIGRMTTYFGLAGCKETLGKENRERYHLE